jgi:hypothetical protein
MAEVLVDPLRFGRDGLVVSTIPLRIVVELLRAHVASLLLRPRQACQRQDQRCKCEPAKALMDP